MWSYDEWKRDVITSVYDQITRHASKYLYANYVLGTEKRKHPTILWPHLGNSKHKFHFWTCSDRVKGQH